MKIGASTLAGIEYSLEDTLGLIEELGLNYAELVHQFPNETISVDLLESFNLNYSIHSPFIDVNIASLQNKSRLNAIKQIKSSIKLANKLDGEAVVVHPGTVPFLANKYFRSKVIETANKAMIELGKYGEDLGVLTTFENMPLFDNMIYSNIEKLHELLANNNLSMTLDIGHAKHAGYPADEMYFDSIKHIHIHDNFGDDDSHLALGDGSIDLNHIVNTLEKNNYDGIYIIEVNNYDSIRKSYEYMKKNF
ncbi:Sugar phosphate isomerase/epimerase [Methanobrevibacter gottschalkii]|uniref:Sugar phosphate isomerase/epimerase n=1 Tax=Methanobrevibacter gottschalkii TaxID=190974 RepID=A0A1H7FDS0_9EURY|nr:sugar phosphate isomerase/epimerase [Methanobrevibacter gottschalkii]SEK22552.1 Sugar phosphate isomerase/epimerase [Methanobrevibacter gottschalkii]